MTEEEGELTNQVCNDYWTEFGQLVAKHLQRVPRHLQDEVMGMLQDRSSCYGSNYSKHMPRDTPLIERLQSIIKREPNRQS